jgi:predicted CXXCH cytochrome family protein
MHRFIARLLLIAGFGLIGALSGRVISAQEPGDSPSPQETPPPSGEGQQCAECHIDVAATWQGSTHANAFADPAFQSAYQASGDVQCLSCHTTGFEAHTGQYQHEGVTCEACHGNTPANHPAEPIAVDPGPGVCTDCHPTTYVEWDQSAHGAAQVACVTCHNPHPQQLKADSAEGLCLSCHAEDAREDYVHTTHQEQGCADCHWYAAIDNPEHIINGSLLPTGHDNAIETRTCTDCHEESLEPVSSPEEELRAADQPLLRAQLEIDELEAEIDTVETQGQNTATVRMVQGLIAGLLFGGAITLLLAWFGRSRDIRQIEEPKE